MKKVVSLITSFLLLTQFVFAESANIQLEEQISRGLVSDQVNESKTIEQKKLIESKMRKSIERAKKKRLTFLQYRKKYIKKFKRQLKYKVRAAKILKKNKLRKSFEKKILQENGSIEEAYATLDDLISDENQKQAINNFEKRLDIYSNEVAFLEGLLDDVKTNKVFELTSIGQKSQKRSIARADILGWTLTGLVICALVFGMVAGTATAGAAVVLYIPMGVGLITSILYNTVYYERWH